VVSVYGHQLRVQKFPVYLSISGIF